VEIRFNGHCQIFSTDISIIVYTSAKDKNNNTSIGPKIEEIRVGLNKFQAGQEKLIKNIED